MDVQVQVAGQITSKPTRNGGTKFDIPLSNGIKPSCFDAALATKVSGFGGAPFTARLEQKGQYWNLIDAFGSGEQFVPQTPAPGTPISQPFTPDAATPTPIVPADQSGGGKKFGEADIVRITKLATIGTAYGFLAAHAEKLGIDFDEAVQWADSLALKLYKDARSHEPGAVPTTAQIPVPTGPIAPSAVTEPVATVPANPQAVAAFVAEQAGAPVVQVGAAEADKLPWATS